MSELALINFFKSVDDGDNWEPIPKTEVPEDLLADHVIERMIDGEACWYGPTQTAYMVMKAPTCH